MNLVNANEYLLDFHFPFDGQRVINKSKYTGRLEKYADEIADNTYYVSWSNLKAKIRSLIVGIQLDKFYIYLPSEVISSELVMTSVAWDLIHGKVLGFTDTNNAPGENIVIIDDWSITGISKMMVIHEFISKNTNISFNFHIIIPYMTDDAKCALKNLESDSIHIHLYACDTWAPYMMLDQLNLVVSDIKIAEYTCCPKEFYLSAFVPAPFNIKAEIQQFFPHLIPTRGREEIFLDLDNK